MTAARRVVLGADAWQVLLERYPGLGDLPAPLRLEDGPVLDAVQRGAAASALRHAGLLGPDRRGAPGLHRTLQACLLVHLRPAACLDVVVVAGPRRTTGRFASAGPLAAGLLRGTHDGSSRRRTGPVELVACLAHDLPGEVWRLLERPREPGVPPGTRALLLRRVPAPVRAQVLVRTAVGWLRPPSADPQDLVPADEGDVRLLLGDATAGALPSGMPGRVVA